MPTTKPKIHRTPVLERYTASGWYVGHDKDGHRVLWVCAPPIDAYLRRKRHPIAQRIRIEVCTTDPNNPDFRHVDPMPRVTLAWSDWLRPKLIVHRTDATGIVRYRKIWWRPVAVRTRRKGK